ncbi:hypothetical protein TL16_g03653 [Triparma laevis f. inornata]|uniref:Myotubularin phosphatase domain-containing protein n=1 Tax=Triparma laevis f. inornata TaxID=1714386 RepID=A0A9W7A8E6_9STRA|nr:hypothetical protein TL16_g03653 [Triparma laevis f. inornata]
MQALDVDEIDPLAFNSEQVSPVADKKVSIVGVVSGKGQSLNFMQETRRGSAGLSPSPTKPDPKPTPTPTKPNTAGPSDWDTVVRSQFLPGETVLMHLQTCQISTSSSPYISHPSRVLMTQYRLAFSLNSGKRLQIPLGDIFTVNSEIKNEDNKNVPTQYTVIIVCKGTMKKVIMVPGTQAEAMSVFQLLQGYAFPGRQGLEFLFTFEGKKTDTTPSLPPYNAEKEFNRQKIFNVRKHPSPASGFKAVPSPYRISTVNKDYSICHSYPRDLIVPRHITDDELIQVAAFRSEGRLPIMSWGNGSDSGSIWRCSQPKVGLQGNQNAYDEKILKIIGDAVRHDTAGTIGGEKLRGANATSWEYDNCDRNSSCAISFSVNVDAHVAAT